MTQLSDWKRCYALWSTYMYHEAVEIGYDPAAAAGPGAAFAKANSEYSKKYGEAFNPNCEPETSILDDAEEIGLRVQYNAFLGTPGTDPLDFEQWLARREAV